MLRTTRSHARSWLAPFVSVLLAAGAAAQARPRAGDVLLCRFAPGGPSLVQHYHADGELVQTCSGTYQTFEGAVLTRSGKYASAGAISREVHLFDEQGAPAGEFAMPQMIGYTGDLDVFSDGTLAVVDQSGFVRLYDESGAYQGTFAFPGLAHPLGIHIDRFDNLWACDIGPAKQLVLWDRQGTPVSSLPLDFDPGDLVRDLDGSLWVTDRPGRFVVHLAPDGTVLARFYAGAVTGECECIGLHYDGTLYVAGEADWNVHRYDKSGTWLESLPIGGGGQPVFLTIVGGAGLGGGYCFGDEALAPCPCGNPGATGEGCAHSGGEGARLLAVGSASVSVDALAFVGQQLVPNQPVLLFAGANAVNGGLGTHFGDGLRCAGGAVVRLGVTVADAGGAAHWGPGLLAGTSWVAGDTRRFQAWYRDPAGSPCGSAFNLSNGVEVALRP